MPMPYENSTLKDLIEIVEKKEAEFRSLQPGINSPSTKFLEENLYWIKEKLNQLQKDKKDIPKLTRKTVNQIISRFDAAIELHKKTADKKPEQKFQAEGKEEKKEETQNQPIEKKEFSNEIEKKLSNKLPYELFNYLYIKHEQLAACLKAQFNPISKEDLKDINWLYGFIGKITPLVEKDPYQNIFQGLSEEEKKLLIESLAKIEIRLKKRELLELKNNLYEKQQALIPPESFRKFTFSGEGISKELSTKLNERHAIYIQKIDEILNILETEFEKVNKEKKDLGILESDEKTALEFELEGKKIDELEKEIQQLEKQIKIRQKELAKVETAEKEIEIQSQSYQNDCKKINEEDKLSQLSTTPKKTAEVKTGDLIQAELNSKTSELEKKDKTTNPSAIPISSSNDDAKPQETASAVSTPLSETSSDDYKQMVEDQLSQIKTPEELRDYLFGKCIAFDKENTNQDRSIKNSGVSIKFFQNFKAFLAPLDLDNKKLDENQKKERVNQFNLLLKNKELIKELTEIEKQIQPQNKTSDVKIESPKSEDQNKEKKEVEKNKTDLPGDNTIKKNIVSQAEKLELDKLYDFYSQTIKPAFNKLEVPSKDLVTNFYSAYNDLTNLYAAYSYQLLQKSDLSALKIKLDNLANDLTKALTTAKETAELKTKDHHTGDLNSKTPELEKKDKEEHLKDEITTSSKTTSNKDKAPMTSKKSTAKSKTTANPADEFAKALHEKYKDFFNINKIPVDLYLDLSTKLTEILTKILAPLEPYFDKKLLTPQEIEEIQKILKDKKFTDELAKTEEWFKTQIKDSNVKIESPKSKDLNKEKKEVEKNKKATTSKGTPNIPESTKNAGDNKISPVSDEIIIDPQEKLELEAEEEKLKKNQSKGKKVTFNNDTPEVLEFEKDDEIEIVPQEKLEEELEKNQLKIKEEQEEIENNPKLINTALLEIKSKFGKLRKELKKRLIDKDEIKKFEKRIDEATQKIDSLASPKKPVSSSPATEEEGTTTSTTETESEKKPEKKKEKEKEEEKDKKTEKKNEKKTPPETESEKKKEEEKKDKKKENEKDKGGDGKEEKDEDKKPAETPPPPPSGSSPKKEPDESIETLEEESQKLEEEYKKLTQEISDAENKSPELPAIFNARALIWKIPNERASKLAIAPLDRDKTRALIANKNGFQTYLNFIKESANNANTDDDIKALQKEVIKKWEMLKAYEKYLLEIKQEAEKDPTKKKKLSDKQKILLVNVTESLKALYRVIMDENLLGKKIGEGLYLLNTKIPYVVIDSNTNLTREKNPRTLEQVLKDFGVPTYVEGGTHIASTDEDKVIADRTDTLVTCYENNTTHQTKTLNNATIFRGDKPIAEFRTNWEELKADKIFIDAPRTTAKFGLKTTSIPHDSIMIQAINTLLTLKGRNPKLTTFRLHGDFHEYGTKAADFGDSYFIAAAYLKKFLGVDIRIEGNSNLNKICHYRNSGDVSNEELDLLVDSIKEDNKGLYGRYINSVKDKNKAVVEYSEHHKIHPLSETQPTRPALKT